MTAVANLFERLSRPAPTESRTRPEANTASSEQAQKIQCAQKLLDWLLHRDRPTVCIKEILIFGPRCLRRERERAIDSAAILVQEGWLVRTKKHRRDGHKWEIVRKPIVHRDYLTVATQDSHGSHAR
jgi:hypothetical protein